MQYKRKDNEVKRLIIIAAVLAITAACGGNPTVVRNPNNTSTITNLDPAGNYLITLTDSNSNSYQISGWLSEVSPPSVTSNFFLSVQPETCNNKELTFKSLSGSVSGTAFNPTLIASWTGGSATISMSTTVASTQDAFSGTYSLSSLPAWCLPINITSPTGTVSAKQLPYVTGTYTGTLTDAAGSTIQVSFSPQMNTDPSTEADLTMPDGTLYPGGFTGGTLSVTGNTACGAPSPISTTIVVPANKTSLPVYPQASGAQRGAYVVITSDNQSGIPVFTMDGLMDTATGATITLTGSPGNGTVPYGLSVESYNAQSGATCNDNYTGTLKN